MKAVTGKNSGLFGFSEQGAELLVELPKTAFADLQAIRIFSLQHWQDRELPRLGPRSDLNFVFSARL